MEMKTAISCTILRHTKILIAVGVCIISLATLGSKNHTTNITKIVTQSIGIIINRLYFFFQAEDGIRDIGVTGVQTCALPILAGMAQRNSVREQLRPGGGDGDAHL